MLYSDMDEQPFPFPPGVQLVEATPEDFPHLAAFLTELHPNQPVAAESLERLAGMRLPEEPFQGLLALQDGELVGLTETSVPRMDGHPGWLSVEIATSQPELAAPLLAQAEAFALQHAAHTLVTRVREDWWEKEFYEAHGYYEHDRMWPSTLDLNSLNFDQFAAQEAQALATGIQIRPLSELGEFDETQQRKLYELMAGLLRDVPSATPISVWPFEVWQHRFASKLKHPEGLMLAVAPNGEWVGISELHMPSPTRQGTLHNGLTGVKKEWRGNSIGLALKLAAARAALARGFTRSRTSNHSINRPMLAINEVLGFVREAATVTLRKEVGD